MSDGFCAIYILLKAEKNIESNKIKDIITTNDEESMTQEIT